ncbi:2-polyprenyl-6-methoxyphenol hydroxylase-like FAD-dependent oxidoreductase [Crossiella equi]|uniref:2-polyprenyl-6-methoxyphenol hydroxylase-like FAD-dependent oxidoreductase n=1 Tax=Crossiella equi TaxID=130796 RepID=A0ABS5A8E1_9PSEU|nr:styrene monooxygenase/indole monooxygenase family protein [Crossiella equi]MBP2472868.1 2-polyprenyl-6-methoxyphenol hydroxylase-like FAD-dependent oxidoreductase [Crossiella equi]
MGRRIAIVGSGQSGLQLGVALRRDGHDVTLYSPQTPEQIGTGKLTSSAVSFGPALEAEHAAGLSLWHNEDPTVNGLRLRLGDGRGGVAVGFQAPLGALAQAVDQRVKFPAWLAEFTRLGGDLRVETVTEADLDRIAARHDLTVVASGKGGLSTVFPVRATTPAARTLGLCAVHGARVSSPDRVTFSIQPGIGELIAIPALTADGPAWFLLLESVPGGPADIWHAATDPTTHLHLTQELIRTHFPWEASRFATLELVDQNSWLSAPAGLSPTVREPVCVLPSGRAVLGLADAVVLNDPIAGQGANNAAHHAALLRSAIAAHDGAFDPAWMAGTFARFWARAEWSTKFSHALLAAPPAHVQRLLGLAGMHAPTAARFVRGFVNPVDLGEWFFTEDAAERYLATV